MKLTQEQVMEELTKIMKMGDLDDFEISKVADGLSSYFNEDFDDIGFIATSTGTTRDEVEEWIEQNEYRP